MLKYVYIDYNELVELEKPTQRDKEALECVQSKENYKILLSPWHLVEAAQRNNMTEAMNMGKFIESLNPHWLRDRSKVHESEVKAGFYKEEFSCQIKTEASYQSFVQIVVDLKNFSIPTLQETPSDFIRVLKQRPSIMKDIEKIKKEYPGLLKLMQEVQAAGEFTKENQNKIVRCYIKQHIPLHSPDGGFVLPAVKEAFINKLDFKSLISYPSIYIEFLFSKFKRLDPRRRGKGSDVPDHQHIVPSLAYAQVFVTRERYLQTGAAYVKSKACIPVAEIYDSLASFLHL